MKIIINNNKIVHSCAIVFGDEFSKILRISFSPRTAWYQIVIKLFTQHIFKHVLSINVSKYERIIRNYNTTANKTLKIVLISVQKKQKRC